MMDCKNKSSICEIMKKTEVIGAYAQGKRQYIQDLLLSVFSDTYWYSLYVFPTEERGILYHCHNLPPSLSQQPPPPYVLPILNFVPTNLVFS